MEHRNALSDRILMGIDKPARYTGGEVNSVYKNKDIIDIRFAMCFPDVYEIGMSNLGLQIIYDMFNRRDDIWCERVFSPWPDLHKIMKDEGIRLFALESQDPVSDFDFLGISLSYEMAYTNILQILDLSGLPFYAKDRGEECPLVIAGGPCAFNPEPYADFFDIIYIGEGETSYYALMDLYKEHKRKGYDKAAFLEATAKIPGLYVPSLYEVGYNDDDTVKFIRPVKEGIPEKVIKQTVIDFENAPYPEKPVVPYIQAVQDKAVLEIQRGCVRGCRFCQAGIIYRPLRIKPIEQLKKYIDFLIMNTGYEEISFSSLSSSDFPYLKELIDYIQENYKDKKLNISLPSLRVDAFSLDVMSKIQDVKKSSLTFAPEAGTQRLRDVINKGLTEEDIMDGAGQAFKGGWNRVKLYFMLGLPTETEEDVLGIPEIAERMAELYYDLVPKEERTGKVQITISTSFFIPKSFTPFQWANMLKNDEYSKKAFMINDHVKGLLNKKSIKYNWHDTDTTIIEGVLARGDRRLSKAIVLAYEKGCFFDAWTDYFEYDKWLEAIEEAGLSLDHYIYRERAEDEVFPWDMIDCGVRKDFLLSEYKRALEEKTTPDCFKACSGCGAAVFGGGICFENKG